jgi:hypothetical protein
MGYDDTEEMHKAIEKAFTNRIRSFGLGTNVKRSREWIEPLRGPSIAGNSANTKWVSYLCCNAIAHVQCSYFNVAVASSSYLIHLKGTSIFWMHWDPMGCPQMNLI